MKTAKSLLVLLLAFLMVFSLSACNTPAPSSDSSSVSDSSGDSGDSSGSEQSDPKAAWEGMEFDVTVAVTAATKDETWWNTDIYNAVVAWSEETGVKLNLLNGGGTDVLLAAQAAGKGYDLIRNSVFPTLPASGICQPVEDYLAGYEDIFDQVEVDTWKGHVWGLTSSYCNYISGMQYNDTLFKNMGLKTPKEYYLEDNWTWDTFLECAKATTKDNDSDGVTDLWGCSYVDLAKNLSYSIVEIQDNGYLKTRLDNDYNREVIQFVYDLCSVEQVVPPASVAKEDLSFEKGTIAMKPHSSLYGTVLENGDLLSVVPMPKQNKDAEYVSIGMNDYRYYVGAACEHPEVMVDLAAYLQKNAHMLYRDKRLDLKNKGEDIEYIKALDKTLMAVNRCEYFSLSGVANYLPSDHSGDFGIIFTTPPATSLASLVEIHQAQLDTYNKKYIDIQ